MKITDVEMLYLQYAVLVRMHTDEGISGLGECRPRHGRIIQSHIETSLKPVVVGMDPFDTEAIVERMFVSDYKTSGQMQSMAGSCIELALWDIKGKALGVPAYKLLGGAYRKKVPVYASSMRRDIEPLDEAKRMAKLIQDYGYRAVKIRIGKTYGFDQDQSPGRSLKVVQEVRAAIGDDVDLLVDGNSCFSASRAIEIGRKLEKYNIFHFEEPCPFNDLDSTARVAAALDMPVAGGEQEWDVKRFAEILEKRAVDIVQPDVTIAWGFTGCKRVASLADAFGAFCTLHNGWPNVGTAAMLHFAASTPSCRYAQEYSIEPNPIRDILLKEPLTVVDGSIEVPEKPGLGVELDEQVVKHYRQ